jgi:hypothetical protein
MNTSDQSLFPMDSAFKRRWEWKYVPVDYECPMSQFKIKIDADHQYQWSSFLETINGIIYDKTHSEDKQMGNFFVKGDDNFEVSIDQFVSKVMFYLWSEVCKDNPKARKEIFVWNDEGEKEDGSVETIAKEFTFNDLFSPSKEKKLIGFMAKHNVEKMSGEQEWIDPLEIAGETEKQRWEHEIYFDDFIEYIKNANTSPFTDFKTTLPGTGTDKYKTHLNGFVVKTDFGGWISFSRNKDVNIVSYGHSDCDLMRQIFADHGQEIEQNLGIPPTESTKRSESRWMFTDKQGRATLVSPHDLNRENEYNWFIEKAIELYNAFKGYVNP